LSENLRLLLPSVLLFSWVLFFDDLLQVADGNFDVLGGGGDLAVAEDLLHVGDVGASLEKVSGAGVAERVRVEAGMPAAAP